MQVSTDSGATWVAATSATFAAGQTNNVRVRVPIINDALDETGETFTLDGHDERRRDRKRQCDRHGHDHRQRRDADAGRSTT